MQYFIVSDGEFFRICGNPKLSSMPNPIIEWAPLRLKSQVKFNMFSNYGDCCMVLNKMNGKEG